MKKLFKKLGGFIFLLVLSCSNLSVCAAEGTVSDISVYHAHKGSTSGGGCYNQPKYHSHVGNTASGGSCYTPVYHTHQGDTTNGGKCYGSRECGGTTITPYGSHYIHKCTICGCENIPGDSKGEGPDEDATPGEICDTVKCSEIVYYLNCTRTNAVEYYQLSCKKTATTIDSYAMNCGKTPSTVVGKLQLNKVSGKEYRLSVSATNVVINSCTWNGGESGQTILVTANKEYSCQVAYTIEGRSETAVLRYTVTDYDTLGPNVTVNYNDNIWELDKTISIIAVDEGVGLHNAAYRYHNGIIWSDWSNQDSYQIRANGTYSVEVRDAIGNTTEKSFTITHIDTVAPEVTVSCEQTKNIIVNAKDAGAGLHTQAYRYYNGTTWSEWSENATYKAENDGMHQIEIRDALGNTVKKEILIKTVTNTITNTITNILTNPTKQEKEETEKVPDVSNEKVPSVEKVPTKETITHKKDDNVIDREEEVVVESGTIDVKNAFSEPEKEEFVYQKIMATEEIEEVEKDVIIVEKGNDSIEPYYVQGPYEEIVQMNQADSNEYSQMACAMGAIGAPFLLFWRIGNTKIYSVNEQGKRKFLCRAFLTKKGKLKISRFYLKRNKSNTILIKPSKLALEKKRGKAICIRIGKRDFQKQIQEEILLEY